MPYNVACPLFYLLITILSPSHTTKPKSVIRPFYVVLYNFL